LLAPLAVVVAWWGGIPFLCFWTIAGLGVLWEWDTLVCEHDRNSVVAIGAVAMLGAAVLLTFDRPGGAVALFVLVPFALSTLASRIRRSWCAAGLFYAAALLVAPTVLRKDATLGFQAILFLFTVVWLTDIASYFVGRAAGGPKLMPRVSPNK